MSLFEKYLSIESLYAAYRATVKGSKKYKTDAARFHKYNLFYLQELHREIHDGTYEPGPYVRFQVYEPKERIINAPGFTDKVVQFAVHQALVEVYGNVYIKHSYACLNGRGPHRCARQIQHNMRLCKRSYADP